MAYRLVERQVIFNGIKVRLELHHLENEEGVRTRREVVVHPGAVVVLPLLEDRGETSVVLIRNRRYAIGGQYLIELPAGTLEKGEDPINCAGRELLEETGYLAGRITKLRDFYTSPGFLSEKMFAFVATGLEKQQAALEEGEEIEVLTVGYAEALAMVGDGRIADGKTIATLLMYDRFFKRK
jgi:ADP-ribose pyrophosphatase